MGLDRPAPPAGHAPPLSDLLQASAACVLAVERGRSLADALPQVAPALRPGAQALTFLTLRHWGQARAVAQRLVQRKPGPEVHALLCTALALLMARDATQGHASHTVVDQAVEAARHARQTRLQAGFLNACLRRYLREQQALETAIADDPVARWNHPLWWIQRVLAEHAAQGPDMLAANNQPGPMTLRVNRRRLSRDAYRAALAAQGLNAQAVGEDGLVLEKPQPVERLPGFAEGHFSVQDAAAQLAAGLLLEGRRWQAGDRVLDACAAPGGKTAHLLERADIDLLALDVDAGRCARIHDTLQRLGLDAAVQVADAAHPGAWWDGQPFDAILLDAPCTASGIVRRHPDVRWLRRASDVGSLVAQQRLLLERLWPLLKPGGRLLYATCSVFLDEGERQVQAFLERHSDACLQPSPGHILPGAAFRAELFNDNVPGGYDGFFYARIDKKLP